MGDGSGVFKQLNDDFRYVFICYKHNNIKNNSYNEDLVNNPNILSERTWNID